MTVPLGKPAPSATGKITVTSTDTPTLFATPLGVGTLYRAAVDTVGPGGSARSAATSNPFGFETRSAPAPATAVAVR